MVPGVLYKVFSVGPLVFLAHEIIDGLRLGTLECLSEILSDEAITESVDRSLIGYILGSVSKPEPS
jgi:hypothetical protein